MRNTINLFV